MAAEGTVDRRQRLGSSIASITFSDVTVTNVARAVRGRRFDPYVRWNTNGGSTETHYLRNVLTRRYDQGDDLPSWDGEYTMEVPAGSGTVEVAVGLWDWQRQRDRFIAGASIEISVVEAIDDQPYTIELTRGAPWSASQSGQFPVCTFRVTVEPSRVRGLTAAEELAAGAAEPPSPVIRREIRALPEEEQHRFARALAKMMEDGADGPESSPFFRLASLHGWPGKGTETRYAYCEHRQETFPGWHRAYLVAFEEALQAADRDLGNDGRIALPYWDVLGQPSVNGEVFPSILREYFPNGVETVRRLLVDPASVPDDGRPKQASQRRILWERGYQIVDDETLRRAVTNENLAERTRSMLWVAQHYRAASTFGSSNEDSLETPHDLIHVLCSYPMKSLMHAAFHPAFWLHHCNIDRLYSAYLSYHPDSAAEFESNQEAQRRVNQRRKRRDRFDAWLEPFHLPRVSGREGRFYPRHTFDTAALGYAYDQLQVRPAQALRSPPTLAVFEGIDANALSTSYTLFVFVYRRGAAPVADPPPLGPSVGAMLDHSHLGGIGALFAGRAELSCENCESSEPFDVRVDVTAALARLGLAAGDAELHVVCHSADDDWQTLEQTSGVPTPMLRGGGGLPPPTPRFDVHDHEPAGSHVHEPAAGHAPTTSEQGDRPTFPPGSTVTYAVEAVPGYLSRGAVIAAPQPSPSPPMGAPPPPELP